MQLKEKFQKKVDLVERANSDFLSDFGISLPRGTGFSKSDNFHFLVYKNRKYVHKYSLYHLITDADDIDKELDFSVTDFHEAIVQLKNEQQIFPKLIEESEHFYIFEYYSRDDGWFPVEFLTTDHAIWIKNEVNKLWRGKKKVLSPFYSQQYGKIVRKYGTNEIRFIDLKYMELVKKHPLFVYFCSNEKNDLYLIERNLNPFYSLKKRLSREYPFDKVKIHKLY